MGQRCSRCEDEDASMLAPIAWLIGRQNRIHLGQLIKAGGSYPYDEAGTRWVDEEFWCRCVNAPLCSSILLSSLSMKLYFHRVYHSQLSNVPLPDVIFCVRMAVDCWAALVELSILGGSQPRTSMKVLRKSRSHVPFLLCGSPDLALPKSTTLKSRARLRVWDAGAVWQTFRSSALLFHSWSLILIFQAVGINSLQAWKWFIPSFDLKYLVPHTRSQMALLFIYLSDFFRIRGRADCSQVMTRMPGLEIVPHGLRRGSPAINLPAIAEKTETKFREHSSPCNVPAHATKIRPSSSYFGPTL